MRVIFSLLLIIGPLWLNAQDEEATTRVKLNQQVPEFSFKNEKGETVSSSVFKGKTVMITFFATWCGPCRQELPHIQNEIYNQYKDNPGFSLLIFGRDHNEKEIADFKVSQGFTMPFYADKNRSVYSLFAKKYIPRNFLIDANGKIIFSETGFSNEKFSKLKEIIASQLQK